MSNNQLSGDLSGLYNVYSHVQAGVGDRKIRQGVPGVCRYCGESDPGKFQSDAHLIPEGMGNRWILSVDECDGCNSAFSLYDDELVQAVLPLMTVGAMRGKGSRVRQSGPSNSGDQIRHNFLEGKRSLSFKSTADVKDVMSVNRDTKAIRLATPTPAVSFRPRRAYKALAKIGVGLLSQSELPEFSKLIAWLRTPDDNEPFHLLEVGVCTSSVGNAPPIVGASLYRRRETSSHVPYMFLVVVAGSICFQLDLLSDHQDSSKPVLLGSQGIKYSVVLGDPEGDNIRLNYGLPSVQSWHSAEKVPGLVERLTLEIIPGTLRATLTPVLRPVGLE